MGTVQGTPICLTSGFDAECLERWTEESHRVEGCVYMFMCSCIYVHIYIYRVRVGIHMCVYMYV